MDYEVIDKNRINLVSLQGQDEELFFLRRQTPQLVVCEKIKADGLWFLIVECSASPFHQHLHRTIEHVWCGALSVDNHFVCNNYDNKSVHFVKESFSGLDWIVIELEAN